MDHRQWLAKTRLRGSGERRHGCAAVASEDTYGCAAAASEDTAARQRRAKTRLRGSGERRHDCAAVANEARLKQADISRTIFSRCNGAVYNYTYIIVM